MRRALEEPLRRIAENAGLDGAVVVGKVEQLKGTKGFNAASGEYDDLVAAAFSNPTKVVTALQNAASIADADNRRGTDAPEKKRRPPMPGAARITITNRGNGESVDLDRFHQSRPNLNEVKMEAGEAPAVQVFDGQY